MKLRFKEIFLSLLLLPLTLLAQENTENLWNGLKWGMSKAEVIDRLNAIGLQPRRNLERQLIYRTKWEGKNLTPVLLKFYDDKLYEIALKVNFIFPSFGDNFFESLVDDLKGEYELLDAYYEGEVPGVNEGGESYLLKGKRTLVYAEKDVQVVYDEEEEEEEGKRKVSVSVYYYADVDFFKTDSTGAQLPADLWELVKVPEGVFKMGCDSPEKKECKKNNMPLHEVYLDEFQITKFEITVDQFNKCVEAGNCDTIDDNIIISQHFLGCNANFSSRGNYPMNCVEWTQAKQFCESMGMGLPTEAQWEKAAMGARGGGLSDIDWRASGIQHNLGGGELMLYARPAGYYADDSSHYGIRDMNGSLSEWVSDWYNKKYYNISPRDNPAGPEKGKKKVIRGGEIAVIGEKSRPLTYRGMLHPVFSVPEVGFRCASN